MSEKVRNEFFFNSGFYSKISRGPLYTCFYVTVRLFYSPFLKLELACGRKRSVARERRTRSVLSFLLRLRLLQLRTVKILRECRTHTTWLEHFSWPDDAFSLKAGMIMAWGRGKENKNIGAMIWNGRSYGAWPHERENSLLKPSKKNTLK